MSSLGASSEEDVQGFELHSFGPYRIGDMLGLGGISAVYAAVDQRTGSRLAMKISLRDVGQSDTPQRDWNVTQFYAEWNALCWLQGRDQSGVPQIFEHGLVTATSIQACCARLSLSVQVHCECCSC